MKRRRRRKYDTVYKNTTAAHSAVEALNSENHIANKHIGVKHSQFESPDDHWQGVRAKTLVEI